ncbi:MAG: DUF6048 family protein [Flavobacteriaceae bacterium]
MRTYIFIISLICSFAINAQEDVKQDSVKTHRFGLRVGADVSKLVKSALNSNYTAFEINADYKFSKRYYLAGAFGNENRTNDETQVNYTTKGSYFNIGVDYNAYENWLDMDNAIYAGLRYGVSSFSHTLNSYSIYNSSAGYWGETGLNNNSQKFDSNTAHWLELIVGLKAEVFNNLYLGVNVQLKNLVINNKPDGFDNLYIPGFGRTYKDSNWGAGFGYTISYFIPFYKK